MKDREELEDMQTVTTRLLINTTGDYKSQMREAKVKIIFGIAKNEARVRFNADAEAALARYDAAMIAAAVVSDDSQDRTLGCSAQEIEKIVASAVYNHEMIPVRRAYHAARKAALTTYRKSMGIRT